ncbi:MAG TPA: Fe-S protein assembly co-chaperone HscB [Bryobacteraceae bacterium]|nr:Fe-S protein assembly co-chaperone HscB [Bryobacteraceae bacterium]
MLVGPPPSDYFAIFGIERKLALDLEDLQRRFYARSRDWHPDRHVRAGAQQLAFAEEASATLNDAWRVLRDPVARAEYVLKTEGFDIGEQRGRDVPPELLEEVFELNMALEEARTGDAGAKAEVAAALTRFKSLLSALDAERDSLFAVYDAAPSNETLARLRGLLNRRKYLQNLVRDASAALA